jgi:hypothetical protein
MSGKYYQNVGLVNSAYNNPEFMATVSMNVSNRLGRQVTKGEQLYIVNMIRKLDEDYVRAKKPADVLEVLTHIILKKLAIQGVCPPMDGTVYVDMHENLKKGIGTTSESNVSNSIYDSLSELQKLGKSEDIGRVASRNPMGLTRKNYFLLDSRYRNADSITNRFTWDYSNTKTQQSGTVSVIGDVRDIVAIRIYPFRLPLNGEVSTYHKRISVLIHEFSTQSFFAHENRRFHFMNQTTVDGNFVEADPYQFNDGYYYFEKPFTTVTSITISFGNPLRLVNLDADSGKCTANYVVIAPLTLITTLVPHGINNNDVVFFSNFSAGYSDTILKNTMNREPGFVITVIDTTNFSINYDTSGIVGPVGGLVFDVYYDSKRFYIPFELEYIKPDL